MQPVARQLQQMDYNIGNGMFSMWSVPKSYLEDNWGDPVSSNLKVRLWREDKEVGVKWPPTWELSVVNWQRVSLESAVRNLYQSVTRRHLVRQSSAWQAVEKGPERGRLKNLKSQKPLPGKGWWRRIKLENLSGCCGDLWTVEISDSAVIACSSESCVQEINKSIHQSIPRL
jgi:hypothetical protein